MSLRQAFSDKSSEELEEGLELLVYAALSLELLVYAALSLELLVYAALSLELRVYAALNRRFRTNPLKNWTRSLTRTTAISS
jgi:hypothetical protein